MQKVYETAPAIYVTPFTVGMALPTEVGSSR